jgi:hypothetical protein
MYNASAAFHSAVANGAHQIPLLIFEDAVFTSADIDVSKGIEFKDLFNAEEDIAIGQTPSNELTFDLLNDNGLLDNYEFGDFEATIGAQIGASTVTANGFVQASSASHTYVAYTESPYLKRDGTAVNSQPTARVMSMLIYGDYVYCYLQNDSVKVYKDSTGTYQNSVTLNDFMIAQMAKWVGKGIHFANNILRIWQGTLLRTYEFVPLGHFTADRPNVPSVINIHFTAYDYMQRFEDDMPSAADLNITYPITIGNLFAALCNYVGVQYETSTFINSTAVINREPEDFGRVTMREVMGWIAEAGASNLKFNREGVLCFTWVQSTDQELDEHGYDEFHPYWYETQQIDRVCNRASNGDYDIYNGLGDGVTYLIQDNPLLKGVE